MHIKFSNNILQQNMEQLDAQTLKKCFYRYSNRFDSMSRDFMWKPRNRFPTYELVINKKTKKQVRRFTGFNRIKDRQLQQQYVTARDMLRGAYDRLGDIMAKLERSFGSVPLKPIQFDVPWARNEDMFRSWHLTFNWCDKKMQQYLSYDRPPSDEERMSFLLPTIVQAIGIFKQHIQTCGNPMTSCSIHNQAAQMLQDILRHGQYWCRALNYHIVLKDTDRQFECLEQIAQGVEEIDIMVDKYIYGLHAYL